MFRPNRIGSPVIHNDAGIGDTTNWTVQEAIYDNAATPFNVINASPMGDFGRSGLIWNGTESITAVRKAHLVQQFTVTAPLNGNVVGVELSAQIYLPTLKAVTIIPVFFKMTAALGAILAGAANSSDMPTYFGQSLAGDEGDSDVAIRHLSYKEQLIIQGDSPTDVSGVYAHGFGLFNNSAGSAAPLSGFFMSAAIRQLNDQQSVAYRDTLR